MASNIVDIVIRATDQFSNVFNNIRNSAENASGNITSSFQRAGANMSSIGKSMSLAISVPIAGIGAAALKAGMDFEAGMSSIKALTGATGEEMVKLHDLALQMGEKTKYSATEAAKGMEELLKAGMSVEQVMSGGLNAALSLATAGELELAEAAEIMSTALNAFKADGMSASDAANILAGTANASATSVGELKFSLAAVASVAAGVGLSFKDTNATLGVFAQNGLKGSDAGTSLKTMLMNLQPHSKAAAATMEQLGIVTADGANQFYTAEGKLKSMGEVAQILKTSMAGLTDAQRMQAMQTMFGSDAIRAANILFKEGGEGIAKMKAEMSNVTAEEVAKEKMNNLKGSIEQLKGALETAGIKMYETQSGPLKALVDMLGNAVSAFNNLSPGMQQTIMIVGLLVAAIGPVLMIVGSLISNIQLCIGAFTAISAAVGGFGGAMTLLTGPVGIAIAAIAALVAIGVALYQNWDTIKEYAGRIWEAVKIIFQAACDAISNIILNWTLPGLIYQHWDAIKAATSEAWEWIKQFLVAVWDGLVQFMMNWTLPGLIYQHWDTIKTQATEVWNTIKQFLVDTWNAITQTATEVWTAISDFFTQNLEGMYTSVQNYWNAITQFYIDCWNGISTNLTTWINGFVDTLTGGWEAVTTNIQNYWNAIVNWLTETWNGIQNTIDTWCQNILNMFNFTWQDVYNGLVSAWNAIGQWLVDCWNSIYNKAVEIWNKIKAVMSGQSAEAASASIGEFGQMEEQNIASMTRTNAGVQALATQQAQAIAVNAQHAQAASTAAQAETAAATTAHHTAMTAAEKTHQQEVKTLVNTAQTEALAALKLHQDQEEAAFKASQEQERAELKAHQLKEQDDLRLHLATQSNMSAVAKEEARIALRTHQEEENAALLLHQQEAQANLKLHLNNEKLQVTTHNQEMKTNTLQTQDEIALATAEHYAQTEAATLTTYTNVKNTIATNMNAAKTAVQTNLSEIKSIQTQTLGEINAGAKMSFNQLEKIMKDPVGSAKDMINSYLKQILMNVLDFRWPEFPTLNIPISVGGSNDFWGNVVGLVGGIFGFAKGGAYPGGVALVGEEGPELINFNKGGYVHTASETSKILGRSGSSSGSGGGAFVIEKVVINANSEAEGRAAGRGFMSEMQKYGIKTRGV